MDKEKKLENKKESIEAREADQKILQEKADEKKAEINHDYIIGHEVVKSLAEKAKKLSTTKDANFNMTQDTIVNLEGIIEELTAETENKIDQETKESAIEHLPNYQTETNEAKMTRMTEASEKIQKRFNEKISPEMKEAIAIICGQVFNQGKYPYALIGSNCYIPHTEHSEKIPDDLDVIFGIKDLGIDIKDIVEEKNPEGRTKNKVAKYTDGAYSRLLKLQEQGLVKDLSVEELRKFGQEKNGCVKIHCFIKAGEGWKEMEAFAQNMDDEINRQGKNKNGIINLGAEPQDLEVVDINGVKANIGSEKTAEELYLKNTVNEFALYTLKGWENKGFLNAKALQRIFNVINLDNQKFEDSIDQMIEKIAQIDPPTTEAKKAQESLKELWLQFKGLPEKGNGLVNHLMESHRIEIPSDNEHEKKILSTEKAVDLITAETKKDMIEISDRYQSLENKYQAYLNSPDRSPEKDQEIIAAIDQEVKNLSNTGLKYKSYINNVNSADKNDFCVYAAMPQLRNQFILPVITKLMNNRKKLEKK